MRIKGFDNLFESRSHVTVSKCSHMPILSYSFRSDFSSHGWIILILGCPISVRDFRIIESRLRIAFASLTFPGC